MVKRNFMYSLLILGVCFHGFTMDTSNDQEKNGHVGELRTTMLGQSKYVYNLVPTEQMEELQMASESVKTLSDEIDCSTLPVNVDFSHYLPKIHVQGKLGSCTGQAITAAMEIVLAKENFKILLSPLYVYYNERKLTGAVKESIGATLADGLRAVCMWGACKEKTWPYSDNKVKYKMKPSQVAYNEARRFTNLDSILHSQVSYSLMAIKSILAKQVPVVFGVYIYKSFEKAKNGRVPIPSLEEKVLGGHALVFVGYDDEKQEFKFANSWGSEWGDRGFGYLSYDYVMNKSHDGKQKLFFAGDIWKIERVGYGTDDSPRESPAVPLRKGVNRRSSKTPVSSTM